MDPCQTGGQDDLVTIFSPWEQRVIARCQGHSSFVSGVAFDEIRCDGRTYRFGSIGEDNKFIVVRVRGYHSQHPSYSKNAAAVGLLQRRIAQTQASCTQNAPFLYIITPTH